MAASSRSSRTRLRFKFQPCGRRSARLIRAATMPGSHGETMPAASSRSRQVRTVRSDSPVYRTSVATDGNAPVPSRPGMVGQADEHELARAGRLAATIGGDRGQIQRPRDRLDAHRAPPGGCAAPSAVLQPVGSVSVSFTPVRSCSRANVNHRSAQVRYTRGRWWMAQRSPRKRVLRPAAVRLVGSFLGSFTPVHGRSRFPGCAGR